MSDGYWVVGGGVLVMVVVRVRAGAERGRRRETLRPRRWSDAHAQPAAEWISPWGLTHTSAPFPYARREPLSIRLGRMGARLANDE